MFMKDNGKMTKLTATDYTHKQVVPFTKENGLTISNMEKVKRRGQMAPNMKEITNSV